MEKENQKTYYYQISLDTPYKWGEGYANATEEAILSNELALKSIPEIIGFELYKDFFKKGSGECDSYYNPDNNWEEIYLHPMEITGTLTAETVKKIIDYLTEKNFPYTKLERVKCFNEERKYTFTEVMSLYNNITDEMFYKLYRNTNGGFIAMNYNFEELGFKFKKYTFCNIIDKDTKLQKDFLIKLLNEKFKDWRNRGVQ